MEDIDWAIDQVGMRQLEVFHKVAETGSFSDAADELGLRQPTVSNHVKQLEELLDSTLILREQGRVALTPLGELCYEKLRSVEAAREDFRQALLEYFESERGTIRVGASTIPGEVLLPRILSEFRRDFPDVEVVLEIKDSARIIERVREGDLRYAMIGTDLQDPQLSVKCLYEDEMILVGHPRFAGSDPVGVEELEEMPYVDRLSGSGTREAVEEFFRSDDRDPDDVLNRVTRLETTQAVKEAVLGGVGVSFLPWSVVYPDVDRGDLVRIPCDFRTVHRRFYGVSNRFLGLSPLLREFESFLETHWTEEVCSDA